MLRLRAGESRLALASPGDVANATAAVAAALAEARDRAWIGS